MCSCGNPLIITTYANKKTGCYCVFIVASFG